MIAVVEEIVGNESRDDHLTTMRSLLRFATANRTRGQGRLRSSSLGCKWAPDPASTECMTPGQIHVRTVLHQPAQAGAPLSGIGRPRQVVGQRRNTARDAVDLHAETMQPLECRNVPASGGDVHRDTIRRVRSGLKQDLREGKEVQMAFTRGSFGEKLR